MAVVNKQFGGKQERTLGYFVTLFFLATDLSGLSPFSPLRGKFSNYRH